MGNNSTKQIVVLGGGFGGMYALKKLHSYFHNDDNVEIKLINKNNYFLFTPLLHEVATGGVSPENVVEPLRSVLCPCIGDFYFCEASSINAEKKYVQTDCGKIDFDYLVIATGSTTDYYNLEGAENTFGLYSVEEALALKSKIISSFEEAAHTSDPEKQKKMLNFTVVGGGPTGVELSAEISEFISNLKLLYDKNNFADKARVNLIHSSDELVPNFSEYFQRKSKETLEAKGVNLMLNSRAKKVGPDFVLLEDGTEIDSSTAVWTAGVKPNIVPFEERDVLSESGNYEVDSTLELENCSSIFAIGDVANFTNENGIYIPDLAQVASQQGPFVGKNIYRSIKGKELKSFSYNHSGDLLSLGNGYALAEIGFLKFSGFFAWWLWRTIYLFKMISWRSKLKTAVDWTVNLFMPRDTADW